MGIGELVSTHSRSKAADKTLTNTSTDFRVMFQHTAARRRLTSDFVPIIAERPVSTHSRSKAAERVTMVRFYDSPMFQHTAARRRLTTLDSQPNLMMWFQHTAARRRLKNEKLANCCSPPVSTHSRSKAAERIVDAISEGVIVSTHSRSKAAEEKGVADNLRQTGFNTQPLEGG